MPIQGRIHWHEPGVLGLPPFGGTAGSPLGSVCGHDGRLHLRLLRRRCRDAGRCVGYAMLCRPLCGVRNVMQAAVWSKQCYAGRCVGYAILCSPLCGVHNVMQAAVWSTQCYAGRCAGYAKYVLINARYNK